MAKEILTHWASLYVKAGWSLIPVLPKSKDPLIPWKEFQTRRADMTEISSWIEKWPDMNLGVVTGNISSLVVVDLDGPEGISSGKRLKLESSVKSLTGNGKQVYYKWTESVANSVKKIAPGVDIRGDGGYVVVPPSIHPNGKRYQWERFVPEGLLPVPAGLVEKTSIPTVTAKGKPEGWIAKALEEMKIGNIDDTLVSVLGRLRRDGYSELDARALLGPSAKQAGATDGHLDDKIRHIWSSYSAKPVISTGLHSVQQSVQQSVSLYDNNAGGLSIHTPANDDSFNKFELGLSGNGHESGIRTGFPTLDRYFEGGLRSQRLFTVAARTGTGKTNFAIALAAHLCQEGKKVLFFSTEFQYQKVWQRYIATLRQPERFREHAFNVCDAFSPRLEQVEEAIRQVKPDVFIFDHINHMGEEREGIGVFMQGCNFLQRKYETQGIMIAQLNRQADWVEGGKRIEPRMSMIKGSGTIEQASSRVLLLSEVKVTPEYNEILGVLDKNDSGDRGLIQFGLYKNPYVLKEL